MRRRPWSRWRARLRHIRRPGDLWTFLGLGLALSLMPAALAVLGLPRLLARLAADGRPAPPMTIEQAQVLALYVDFWLRHQRPHNPCLRRSLVLFGRLRRGGLPATFCLGIGRAGISAPDQPVTGHAWLELGGQVILEPPAAVAAQVRTFCYPPTLRALITTSASGAWSAPRTNDLANSAVAGIMTTASTQESHRRSSLRKLHQ